MIKKNELLISFQIKIARLKLYHRFLLIFLIIIFLNVNFSFIVADDLISNNQTEEDFKYKSSFGGNLFLNNNFYSSDFEKLPTIPNCCTKFESATGFGYNIGLFYNYKIIDQLKFGLNLSYDYINAEYSPIEKLDLASGNFEVAQGEATHFLQANFGLILIKPELIYTPIENLNLIFNFNIALPTTPQYSQKSQITKPSNQYTFLDEQGNDSGKRTRNEYAGEILDVSSLFYGAGLSISYDLPMNKKKSLIMSPTLGYNHYINDAVKSLDWKISNLYLGVRMEYRFENKTKQKPIKPTPNLEPQKPKDSVILALELDLLGLNKGITTEIINLEVEEFLNDKLHPLLPYIFFDKSSSKLETRYKKLKSNETNSFNPNDLYSESTLDIYHNILNIIGWRMKNNQETSLTLVGCNSNEGDEKDNLKLSKNRAVSIKNYLTDVWGINEKRLIVKSKNLPAKFSNPEYEEGNQENRRVELIPSDEKITNYLQLRDTLRVSNPPSIRILPKIKTNKGLKNWDITIYQNKIKYKKYEGKEYISSNYDWELEKNGNNMPRTEKPLYVKLEVEDKDGNREEVIKSIKLDQKTIRKKKLKKIKDKKLNEYHLILFDYNNSELNIDNKAITNLINNEIEPNSNIKIIGYTDKLGESDYNKTLSLKRAEATKKAINSKKIIYEGIGEENLLFDNKLPEGRMYCRTVIVKVETEINNK